MEMYGRIKNSKIVLDNKEALKYWTSNLEEGDDVLVTFQAIKDARSLRQLKLVYSCLRAISDHTGYTVEDTKMLVKMHQGLCAESTIEGKQIYFCRSLGDMTRKELSEFIVKMNDWASLNLQLNLLNFEDIKFLTHVQT
jgi:hypothetical protein